MNKCRDCLNSDNWDHQDTQNLTSRKRNSDNAYHARTVFVVQESLQEIVCEQEKQKQIDEQSILYKTQQHDSKFQITSYTQNRDKNFSHWTAHPIFSANFLHLQIGLELIHMGHCPNAERDSVGYFIWNATLSHPKK